MALLNLLFQVYQWIVALDSKKIVIFLFSLVITILLMENYNLRINNDRLDSRTVVTSNRNDSIKSILEARLQDCNDKRIQDLEKSNLYWSKKVESLESRLYDDFKATKERK